MTIEELKKVFETNNEVRFKLYSLDYVIKKLENRVIIYPTIYETKKSMYNSLDELLNNYLVYGETIIDNESRIHNI